jgi:hypothetical protein
VWADADGDSWLDLLVTIEWGPVKLFRNEGGGLVPLDAPVSTFHAPRSTLHALTGWWNAIAAGDLDHDGDPDFVVANQGLNTKYQAAEGRPEMLFYGNLDGSGRAHLLEAYFVGELGFPHRGRDALAAIMPSLTEKSPTFDQFAKAPIEGVFSMDALRRSQRREANTFDSGVLLNKGRLSFEFVPLPWPAQLAPARDLALADLNGDGHLDLVVAHNDFSPVRETGRMDGGVSLLLLGDGNGNFEPVWPNRSGIVVPGEAARVAIVELNGDARPDVAFGVHAGRLRAFTNAAGLK